jgi:DNA-binding NarL/FixJ family response regulator
MPANPTDLQLTTVFRNCYRCGQDFRASGKDRICSTCRKPKVRKYKSFDRQLSFRERQIAELVCQAKPNKEIAYELHLSEGTVKEYLNKIFRKLGAKNRTELAVWTLLQQASASEEVPSGNEYDGQSRIVGHRHVA